MVLDSCLDEILFHSVLSLRSAPHLQFSFSTKTCVSFDLAPWEDLRCILSSRSVFKTAELWDQR